MIRYIISIIILMIAHIIQTIKYAIRVEGYKSLTEGSFQAQMMGGTKSSDLFRVGLEQPEISLAEYHAAFLCCPLFQLELWFQRCINVIDPVTMTREHLMDVALGNKSSFGPWTSWATNGARTKPVSAEAPKPACQIMRCRIRNKPFCDTWWAVEYNSTTQSPDLVFGTAILGDAKNSIWVKLLDPIHRVYSRLLLGSAKAVIVTERAKRRR